MLCRLEVFAGAQLVMAIANLLKCFLGLLNLMLRHINFEWMVEMFCIFQFRACYIS